MSWSEYIRISSVTRYVYLVYLVTYVCVLCVEGEDVGVPPALPSEAHVRQSRPDQESQDQIKTVKASFWPLLSQVKVLNTAHVVPSSLGSVCVWGGVTWS